VAHPFDRFEEIVLGDTEFVSRTGELYRPVCLAYKELRSGRCGSLFYDDFEPTPPHVHGKNILFVGFTGAEPEFYLSIGWPFETAFLDLRVEGIHQTNFAYQRGDPQRQKLPRSLISFLRANNIHDGDEARKDVVRKRIMQGAPFTPEERSDILKYCLDDVLLLEKLLAVLVLRIANFEQALMRGEYVKLTAEMFRRGLPADPWSAGLLRMPEVRQAVRLRAVSDTSLTHGLYQGPTLSQLQMREFLVRHGVKGWRKTASGHFGTAGSDFERLEEQRPEFGGIADAHKMVTQLHELQLSAGPDGRYRTPIWAYSTITSRAAPNGAAFPFTTPSWCRYTLMPAAGKVLAYLDFASMEFGVAAGLSKAPMMVADYGGEPYLILPILAGFLPCDATRRTHGDVRDTYKPMILAVQYGGGGGLLARRLGLTASQGQRIVDLHHDRYEPYWEWSDRKLQHAFDEGELIARDGWRCGINTRTSVFTARNWLIQANAAAIFRYAGLLMRHLGIRIIAPVHDAVLLEANIDQIDREVVRATYCLERASRRFLHGLTLKVDVKYVYPGDRFTDKRGEKTWAFVERSLRELEEGKRDVAG
jgi:DNA polymerase I